MARKHLTLVASLLLLRVIVPAPAAAATGESAILVDLDIHSRVEGDVVVFGGDLHLGPDATVTGDAVSIGGTVRVESGARVGRHVMAVFGRAEVAPGASVDGKVIALTSMALLTQASATEADPGVELALRVLTSGVWLTVTTLLAFFLPVRMRYATWLLPLLGVKVPVIGLMVLITAFAAWVAALGLGPGLGVPVGAALMVVFAVGKAVGLSALGGWAGSAVIGRWVRHPIPLTAEVFVGVLLLLALRFLPVVGSGLWTVVSVVALGACVATISVEIHGDRVEASSS